MPDPNDQANGAQPGAIPGQDAGGQQPGSPQPGGAAPETFSLDGRTLTPDDIRAALKAKTDYDQFLPEFHQRSQILSNPDKFKEYGAKKFPDLFPALPAATPAPGSPEEEAQRTRAWLKENKFMTREEAEKLADERATKLFEQREADKALKEQKTALEAEWNGKDGKPKYDHQEVLRFAVDKGYPDLDSAFRALKHPDIVAYEASKRAKTPETPVIAPPGGGGPVAPAKQPNILDDDEAFNKAAEQAGL